VTDLRKSNQHILIVDDDQSLREFLEILFKKEGYQVSVAKNARDALELMSSAQVSLVLSDIRMPGMDGVSFLHHLKQTHPALPVILITAFGSLDTAVTAMKEGAWDYVTKPFNIDELRATIANALSGIDVTSDNDSGLSKKVSRAKDQMHRLDRMIANSPAMLKIFQLIPRVANSPSSVLITGESGTGKELVACAIHNLGVRKQNPFVVVNCGGIPENLLESELFGFCKGAFTGADRDKPGLFLQADKGTLFLDEVGELPMPLQAKLLRVVQQKSFLPLGSTKEIRVDVRIVAATNRNLENEVMSGRFREDLYYRINVINIHVPPLRERREDIPILVKYFLDKYSSTTGKDVAGISSYAMDALMNYIFPGNVRELENIIERSVTLASSNLILPDSLVLSRHKQGESKDLTAIPEITPDGFDLEGYLENIEKKFIIQALDMANNSKTEAAKLLKLNFRSFRYRLAKYGL